MTFDPYRNKPVKILEPSAGQGGIIEAVYDWFENEAIHLELESVTAVEFMAENFCVMKEKFSNRKDIELINMDFLKYDKHINYFDYIIANPPFSNGQDIKHFQKMYDLCKADGIVTSIMSTGWIYNSQKKFKEFREWLGINDRSDELSLIEASKGGKGYIGTRISEHEYNETVILKGLESGKFSESGTNVITCILQVQKNDIVGFTAEPVIKNNQNQLALF